MSALLGVDFGGTKIEAAALAPDGTILARRRAPNPGHYDAAVETVGALVAAVLAQAGIQAGITGPLPAGIAIPGSENPHTGLIRNANTTWLNGRRFARDLEDALDRDVRLANDANCFALSEATDGAAAGARPMFGVIIGTGCGGGVVTGDGPVPGANGIAGEWGHIPLPWMNAEEQAQAPACWCGRRGCLETWLSGPAMTADHARATGRSLSPGQIAAQAGADPGCAATLDRYRDRLARALALIADMLDPEIVVLGGGLSNIGALYDGLPQAVARYAFCDAYRLRVAPALHGDSSGVRGAAWLWRGART